jgi:hypothetical protein
LRLEGPLDLWRERGPVSGIVFWRRNNKTEGGTVVLQRNHEFKPLSLMRAAALFAAFGVGETPSDYISRSPQGFHANLPTKMHCFSILRQRRGGDYKVFSAAFI